MPRVKIDYIVSFSSEDPENPASNLLEWNISKKKWLCAEGEPSCSIVLQLTKAVKINTVHIGAQRAAFIEVLVGRSEKPNDPFQVLVPSSVFLSPMESRCPDGGERVRSFAADQLASDARESRWDRVRVVCSQPYNKHCKYGLTFVFIYEPEGKDQPSASAVTPSIQPVPAPSATPPDRLTLETYSSDEDFTPGELFAKHQRLSVDSEINTDAQIRQATSQALKNIPSSSTKLMKTPIAKTTPKPSPSSDHNTSKRSDRQRNSLMYTDDDDRPNAKIDQVVNRHKEEKSKKADEEKRRRDEEKEKQRQIKEKRDEAKHRNEERRDDSRHRKEDKRDDSRHRNDSSKTRDVSKTPQTHKRNRSPSSSDSRGKDRDRKHPTKDNKIRAGPVSSTPHTLLVGVVFTISGYENPLRAHVRDAALAMGATFQRDWGPDCTHLICAFPNTPKLKKVRASPNGKAAIVVTDKWVQGCCDRRRLLPWQWFATEPALRVAETIQSDEEASTTRRNSENSDDEAERKQQNRKRQRIDSPTNQRRKDVTPKKTRRTKSPSPDPSANESRESDVAFVRDERVKGHVTIADSDTDDTDEEQPAGTCHVDDEMVLPDFFDGLTFVVDDGVANVFDSDLVCRYIRAYGGVLIEPSQLDADSHVDYWLCAGAGGGGCARAGAAVRADWVWRCHESRNLCAHAEYALT